MYDEDLFKSPKTTSDNLSLEIVMDRAQRGGSVMDTKALKKKKQLEDLEAQVQAIVLKQKEEAQDLKRKSWV